MNTSERAAPQRDAVKGLDAGFGKRARETLSFSFVWVCGARHDELSAGAIGTRLFLDPGDGAVVVLAQCNRAGGDMSWLCFQGIWVDEAMAECCAYIEVHPAYGPSRFVGIPPEERFLVALHYEPYSANDNGFEIVRVPAKKDRAEARLALKTIKARMSERDGPDYGFIFDTNQKRMVRAYFSSLTMSGPRNINKKPVLFIPPRNFAHHIKWRADQLSKTLTKDSGLLVGGAVAD